MLTLRQILVQARQTYQEIHASKLYNENGFYPAFVKDLNRCKNDLLIESPFITSRRLSNLLPVLKTLQAKKVRIVINTRDPIETDDEYQRDEVSGSLEVPIDCFAVICCTNEKL